MPAMNHWLRRVASGALRIVMPPLCASCGSAVAGEDSLCTACWRELHMIDRPFCERLGIPLAYDPGGEPISPAALADPPPYGRARAVCLYGDTARTLVHGLKFHDRHDMAALMSRMMARAGAELLCEADLVCPVPLHRMRLWRRRFNQSAMLAGEVGRLSDRANIPDLLLRVRATRQQIGLTHDQRRRNVAGAFQVNPAHLSLVRGARIVLIDDVFTTGATAEACVAALLRAGAAQVDVLTFARVAETVENPI